MAARKRRGSSDRLLYLVLFSGLVALLVASAIATALRSWTGRIWLLVIFGGGGWLAYWWIRRRRRRRRIHAENLGELLMLTPAQFEHAVAQVLEDRGFRRVEVTGRAGDLQADITATDQSGDPVVVQCKRYSPGNKVGSRAIQSFIGMAHVHHRASRAMFVTTSEYTAPAQDLAKEHNIELVDGERLTRMIATSPESN